MCLYLFFIIIFAETSVMDQDNIILFTTVDKSLWLGLIADSHHKYCVQGSDRCVYISFAKTISVNSLTPMHLVTLACLIQF